MLGYAERQRSFSGPSRQGTSQQARPSAPRLLQPHFAGAQGEPSPIACGCQGRLGFGLAGLGPAPPTAPPGAGAPGRRASAPAVAAGEAASPRGVVCPQAWNGLLAHIPRCPEHPEEQATYFCATCECACICAECVVQKEGKHRDHEVMRVPHAHEKLRRRAGELLDEASALEDEFTNIVDQLVWRRKDIERHAARGRASVKSAFERVRTQLRDREADLMESLDLFESQNLDKIDSGYTEHAERLDELRVLQADLRHQCQNGQAVEALNSYVAAKKAITGLTFALRSDDQLQTQPPEEFFGLSGSARAELDMHADGLASLEEAVQRLCGSSALGAGVKLPGEGARAPPEVRTPQAAPARDAGDMPGRDFAGALGVDARPGLSGRPRRLGGGGGPTTPPLRPYTGNADTG